MIEKFIHHVRVELPGDTEDAAGARLRLADKFSRTALRRMTHLGMLAGSVLDGVALGPDDALVYASTFAETRALEDFLDSFPEASPLLFQTSIHPGGIQQVLIGRQQPIARLWPIAGRTRLVEQAVLTALLEPAARTALVGGEERGSWMLDYGVASAQSFAFAVILTTERADARGRISFTPTVAPDATCPTLDEFASALNTKSPLAWQGAGGVWNLQWT